MIISTVRSVFRKQLSLLMRTAVIFRNKMTKAVLMFPFFPPSSYKKQTGWRIFHCPQFLFVFLSCIAHWVSLQQPCHNWTGHGNH